MSYWFLLFSGITPDRKVREALLVSRQDGFAFNNLLLERGLVRDEFDLLGLEFDSVLPLLLLSVLDPIKTLFVVSDLLVDVLDEGVLDVGPVCLVLRAAL